MSCQGCDLIWGFSFRFIQVVGRTQFLVAVGLKSPCSCWLFSKKCPQQLEVTLRSLTRISLHMQLMDAAGMDVCSFKASREHSFMLQISLASLEDCLIRSGSPRVIFLLMKSKSTDE